MSKNFSEGIFTTETVQQLAQIYVSNLKNISDMTPVEFAEKYASVCADIHTWTKENKQAKNDSSN